MKLLYPLALLLPFLLLLAVKKSSRSVLLAHPRFPSIHFLLTIKPSWRLRFRRPILLTLLSSLCVLLALIAARPVSQEKIESTLTSRRNIFFALDVSKSMESPDYVLYGRYTSRLTAVKAVVENFLDARPQDRFGLVVFGSAAFLQSPLTHDHNLLTQILQGIEIGIAGDGTAIGDGLGLSIKRLVELPKSARAIILITDGASNAGIVNPDQAAEIAQGLGIVIHTVGVGTENSSSQVGDFDEATLKRIAEKTSGAYFHAQNTEELQDVADKLNELSATEEKAPPFHPSAELYPLFGWVALLVALTYLICTRLVFLRVP
jgi:Ca-activated chloride channel homolog